MTRIVEVGGPGGTGKTSIAHALSQRHGIPVVGVNGCNSVRAKLRAGLKTAQLATRFRLNPAETLSLFRKCSSVENGLRYIRCSASSVVVLDEGPLRTLHDTRCSSFRERRAWWHYARSTSGTIAGRGVSLLLIHVRLDNMVRRSRYDDRVARGEARRGTKRRFKRTLDRLSRRKNAQSIPALGRAVSALVARCPDLATQVSFEVEAQESPAEIAARLQTLVQGRNPHRWA